MLKQCSVLLWAFCRGKPCVQYRLEGTHTTVQYPDQGAIVENVGNLDTNPLDPCRYIVIVGENCFKVVSMFLRMASPTFTYLCEYSTGQSKKECYYRFNFDRTQADTVWWYRICVQ